MEENLIPSYIVFPFILDSFNLLFFLMSMSLLAPMHRIPRNRKETEAKEEKKNQVSSANTVAETLATRGKVKK